MAKDIKSYILDKLFFPKVAMIDKPGIIVSKTTRKYGSITSIKRMVYHFEDILVNLQLETINELGKEKTSELYYRIGKDLGTRYMVLAKMKRFPSFLLPTIIDYIFLNLKNAGMSVAETITSDKKHITVMKGSSNVICRKTGEGSINAGVASGILSFLTGKNIKARLECSDCPDNCRIVLDSRIEDKYVPQRNGLCLIKNYELLNSPRNISSCKNMPSHHDFIKFKKIAFDGAGKVLCHDKPIIVTEVGLFGIISNHYQLIGREDLLERGVTRGSGKLAEELLKNEKNPDRRMEIIEKTLCALGWGIPHRSRKKDKIIFNFVNAPVSGCDSLYFTHMLNGFLNFIFDKEYKPDKVVQRFNPVVLTLEYVC